MTLVNIYSKDDQDWDFEVVVPPLMSNEVAVKQIKKVIKAVLDIGLSDEDDIQTEIGDALDDAGFVRPNWAGRVCMETGKGEAYID